MTQDFYKTLQISLQGTKILQIKENKEIKENIVSKKFILQGKIATTYIEHKHKITGTSVFWTFC